MIVCVLACTQAFVDVTMCMLMLRFFQTGGVQDLAIIAVVILSLEETPNNHLAC